MSVRAYTHANTHRALETSNQVTFPENYLNYLKNKDIQRDIKRSVKQEDFQRWEKGRRRGASRRTGSLGKLERGLLCRPAKVLTWPEKMAHGKALV